MFPLVLCSHSAILWKVFFCCTAVLSCALKCLFTSWSEEMLQKGLTHTHLAPVQITFGAWPASWLWLIDLTLSDRLCVFLSLYFARVNLLGTPQFTLAAPSVVAVLSLRPAPFIQTFHIFNEKIWRRPSCPPWKGLFMRLVWSNCRWKGETRQAFSINHQTVFHPPTSEV